jgi:hypothetical protein
LIGADGDVERNVYGIEVALSASRFEGLARAELPKVLGCFCFPHQVDSSAIVLNDRPETSVAPAT